VVATVVSGPDPVSRVLTEPRTPSRAATEKTCRALGIGFTDAASESTIFHLESAILPPESTPFASVMRHSGRGARRRRLGANVFLFESRPRLLETDGFVLETSGFQLERRVFLLEEQNFRLATLIFQPQNHAFGLEDGVVDGLSG
jgi:hypothetical protein